MRLLTPQDAAPETGPLTPASASFDPFDPAYLEDPYPTLAGLRASEPVFFAPELNCWVVTRHETVRNVLRDAKRFSAAIASDPLKPLCPMARSIIQGSSFDVPPLLVNNDPPAHTRLRRFMAVPLQPQRLKSLEPFVREVVEAHVDRLLAGAAPADLVRALTWDVPALVLFKLIGIPAVDVERVKAWASSRVVLTWGRPTDDEQIRLVAGAVDYYHYAVGLVQKKLEDPGDDYTSDLIGLRPGNDAEVTLHEITVQIFNLLFAGHETTSSAAANMFLTLLERPDAWQRVCRREVAVADVVDEALRYDPPVQGWRRLAKEDVELDGRRIPAGSRLLLMFAAANRDPERFAQADDFCPGRADVQHQLTFGSGIHFCMGAPLARQELAVMLDVVSARVPTLRRAAGGALDYTPNIALRGARHLHVAW